MIANTFAALAVISITGAFASESTGRTTIPYQQGPYPVHISNHELQTERDDPLAPSPMKRRLMLSVYQPLTDLSECPNPSPEPYAPSLTEQAQSEVLTAAGFPEGMLSRLQIAQCTPQSGSAGVDPEQVPLLIFSHGAQGIRWLHSAGAAAVASGGYTVVSIDHTYDANAVEFPGAETAEDLVRNNYDPARTNGTHGEFYEYLGYDVTPVRSDDVTSVLDAVEAGEIPGLECYSSDSGSLTAGIFGHSLGGGTAALSIVRDERLAGAFSLDGPIFRNDTHTDKPYVVMTSGSTQVDDPLFINDTIAFQYDELLSGYKRWLYIAGSAHNSYSDLSEIVDTLGVRDELPSEVIELQIGTIPGPRMAQIAYSYVVDFFDMLLKGREERLLGGPSDEFEEVVFVRSDN